MLTGMNQFWAKMKKHQWQNSSIATSDIHANMLPVQLSFSDWLYLYAIHAVQLQLAQVITE